MRGDGVMKCIYCNSEVELTSYLLIYGSFNAFISTFRSMGWICITHSCGSTGLLLQSQSYVNCQGTWK